MRYAAVLALVVASSRAMASDPGHPLDCSDWVFLAPGLSCEYWAHYPCPSNLEGCTSRGDFTLDNEGRVLGLRSSAIGSCAPSLTRNRWELYAYDGVSTTVLGYIEDRCNAVGSDALQLGNTGNYFREEHGEWVNGQLVSKCLAPFPQTCSLYSDTFWRPVFRGFTTELEILQSFTPTSSLGFRIPYMPDGLPGADRFDTYTGPLAKPIDFSKAQPLKCNYPGAAPGVGDYLTVADTVSTPAPGQGVYYITAATYEGSTRYGRKRTTGFLSGRDPALLPNCTAP